MGETKLSIHHACACGQVVGMHVGMRIEAYIHCRNYNQVASYMYMQ